MIIVKDDDNPIDLKGKMYDHSLYNRVSDPDMLLISVIHFYVKSFIDQATVLANGMSIMMMMMMVSDGGGGGGEKRDYKQRV